LVTILGKILLHEFKPHTHLISTNQSPLKIPSFPKKLIKYDGKNILVHESTQEKRFINVFMKEK